ncbi:MAG: hypothetical protein ACLFTH_03640 [Candidatus Woesearchaeota archaeon]
MPEKTKKYIRVCPKCHSSDISVDKSQHGLDVIGQISSYVCDNCGFSGNIFPEVPLSQKPATKKEPSD